MVRGKCLDFSPENVRLAFNLPMMQGDEHPYTRRVNFNQRLDQVLMDICVEGAQWKIDSKSKLVQLRRLDLKPVARGWLEFIQRSIIPTSNRSEVTVDRAIMIHSIMIGEEVEVHEVISHEIREDQRVMREEQQRQGRDIEELKNTIGPSRRRRHHH